MRGTTCTAEVIPRPTVSAPGIWSSSAAVEDLSGDLAALQERLGALGGLCSELGWTKAPTSDAGGPATLHPFQPGQTLREAQGHVRTVEQAFEHELASYEDGLREARAWAERSAEQAVAEAEEQERRTAAEG